MNEGSVISLGKGSTDVRPPSHLVVSVNDKGQFIYADRKLLSSGTFENITLKNTKTFDNSVEISKKRQGRE